MSAVRPCDEGFLTLDHVGYRPAGGPWLLQGVDLRLQAGELHCIVGRSGCGKTTLLKLAAGLLAPDAGQVRLRGGPPEQARADIGFVFQSPTLLEWHSALENVLLPIALQRRPESADVARAERLLAQLGLAGHGPRYPRQLSGGQQSRVALARALILDAPLLLLDEPFAALDAITREDLQDDLQAMCRARGTTVLFVTHDIAEAAWLGDRVTVMESGRIVRTLDVALPRPRRAVERVGPAFAALCGELRAALHLRAEALA